MESSTFASDFASNLAPFQYGIALPQGMQFLTMAIQNLVHDLVPGGSDDKICMMMTRLACNRAIESSYWKMDNNSDVGLLMGYVLYRYRLNWNPWIWIPFPVDLDCTLLCSQVDTTKYSSIASGNNCIVQLCKCVSLHL
jgi:hypothetical protein